MAGSILIYGGAGGIGSAIARTLRAAGRAVRIVSRDEGKLRSLGDEIGAAFSVGDVRSAADVERVTAEAGEISGLVYAVGTINLKTFGKLTDEDFQEDFLLNAFGAARAVRAALPALKAADGASILLFSTTAVGQGFASHASIAMAKGAVEGLTRALAAELAPKIRVNAIAPSLVETPLSETLTHTPAISKAVADLHAMQRLGRPEDIAPLAALLLSDDAGWITGQIIGVDGGRSALRTKG